MVNICIHKRRTELKASQLAVDVNCHWATSKDQFPVKVRNGLALSFQWYNSLLESSGILGSTYDTDAHIDEHDVTVIDVSDNGTRWNICRRHVVENGLRVL